MAHIHYKLTGIWPSELLPIKKGTSLSLMLLNNKISHSVLSLTTTLTAWEVYF